MRRSHWWIVDNCPISLGPVCHIWRSELWVHNFGVNILDGQQASSDCRLTTLRYTMIHQSFLLLFGLEFLAYFTGLEVLFESVVGWLVVIRGWGRGRIYCHRYPSIWSNLRRWPARDPWSLPNTSGQVLIGSKGDITEAILLKLFSFIVTGLIFMAEQRYEFLVVRYNDERVATGSECQGCRWGFGLS